MPNPNTDPNLNADDLNEDGSPKTKQPTPDEVLAAKVQEGIDAALAGIKTKLDSAYAARDAANAKAAALEAKEREREIQKLKDDGKLAEAYEAQLADERAKRTVAENKNVELTRDLEVRSILSQYEFRSDKAAIMASSEITAQLVRNDEGVWVHKSGVSVADFVKAFQADEANNFLFKPKVNSGGGSGKPRTGTPTDTKDGSLFSLTQEEVLKRASEGTLRKRK